MKTVVLGKKIVNEYGINHHWTRFDDENGNAITVYEAKPELTKGSKVVEWVELCSFKGEPRYNSNRALSFVSRLNISEEETVTLEKEIFRADLNEMHLHTDKIVEEIDLYKKESEEILEAQVQAFNKMMIASNGTLKAYCDLHKLNPAQTDCIELFKLVYPDSEWEIIDGKMVERKSVFSNKERFFLGEPLGITINSKFGC